MGGGPSIPAPPPPPNPNEAAKANELFYKSSLETYIQKQPEVAALEQSLREKYSPRQRELERQMSALDLQKSSQAALQVERELGPQRSIEAMRRQFEMSPNAFATQQGLGQQAALQFARLYGQNPMGFVPPEVQQSQGASQVDYLSGLPRTGVS
jgi:DNA-binding transcriptional regulator YiaG